MSYHIKVLTRAQKIWPLRERLVSMMLGGFIVARCLWGVKMKTHICEYLAVVGERVCRWRSQKKDPAPFGAGGVTGACAAGGF